MYRSSSITHTAIYNKDFIQVIAGQDFTALLRYVYDSSNTIIAITEYSAKYKKQLRCPIDSHNSYDTIR